MQTFFGDGNQHVGAHRNPDLRLHGVLAGAQESLDAQMLLDPFEEQLDLPALAVQLRDQLGLEGKVVGQKRDWLVRLVLDHHTAQVGRVVLAEMEHCQDTRLVANDGHCGPVYRVRVAPLEPDVALGAGYKEGLRLVNEKQAGEVQITTVHQIERARLDQQVVEYVDLVRLAVGDVDETGDGAAQIEQRVQFDGRLGAAKGRPRIDRQTQIDGGRIEGIDRGIQIQLRGCAPAVLPHLLRPGLCEIVPVASGRTASGAQSIRCPKSIARWASRPSAG